MHDYNCCVIDVDTGRVAMCEAERLSGRKHHVIKENDDILMPIRRCCKQLGCSIRQIDTVVFGHTDDFPCKQWLRRELGKKCFVEVDHHLAHAAGAFYTSPYQVATVVSMDAFGDGASGILAAGDGTSLTEIERISDENSIGLEYLRATIHLGLGGYGSEGKTQGLAPYGEPKLFERYMNEIDITSNGNVKLSTRLCQDGSRLTREGGYLNSELLTNSFLFDYCPRRILPEPLAEPYLDLAASIQKVLEHVVFDLCRIAKRRTNCANLVLSGGVSMNSSMNGHLLNSGEFEQIYCLPMASDRGIGLGAALFHLHSTLGVPRVFQLEHVFYGSTATQRETVRAMKKSGLKYEIQEDVIETVSNAIAKGQIVGFFQGASEMGARALGNRSILADPRNAEMKDIINARIKHREWFRPFAPAVLAHRAQEFFKTKDDVVDLSFMTFTVPATDYAKKVIPATIHVDGTARIQTVKPELNQPYANVIRRFDELTGVPVVLNTSFNDKGEPIVETPEHAIRTFLNTDLDLLCIGNVIARKRN